jgi:hypothetical protein
MSNKNIKTIDERLRSKAIKELEQSLTQWWRHCPVNLVNVMVDELKDERGYPRRADDMCKIIVNAVVNIRGPQAGQDAVDAFLQDVSSFRDQLQSLEEKQ